MKFMIDPNRPSKNYFVMPRALVQQRRDKLQEMKDKFDDLLHLTNSDETHPNYYLLQRTKGFIVALEWVIAQDEEIES
jgi:sugar-specific transcriptional regulator TrmB